MKIFFAVIAASLVSVFVYYLFDAKTALITAMFLIVSKLVALMRKQATESKEAERRAETLSDLSGTVWNYKHDDGPIHFKAVAPDGRPVIEVRKADLVSDPSGIRVVGELVNLSSVSFEEVIVRVHMKDDADTILGEVKESISHFNQAAVWRFNLKSRWNTATGFSLKIEVITASE